LLGQEITSNQYAITDFDPLQPKTALLRTINVEHSHDPGTFELFDYPGGYVTGDEGRTYVNMRLEEVEAAYQIGHGTSSARAIFAGATFTLQDHPVCDAEEYLITAITYQMRNDDMGGGLGQGGSTGALYQAQVTCIPNAYEYRSPRLTPKPIVQGPQTALVVGKSGEEIWVDQYGRVKVKFHWDRDPAKDETSSCWIRVSQGWAGKKWGSVFHPRIGQEVIVDFLEGDPDRPIITGRVYNGDHMPPYELPAHGTVSTIKSDTSPGHQGYNELRFEDKKDSEQVFINAKRRMDERVGTSLYETVAVNREIHIGYDDAGDRNLLVEHDENIHIKNDRYDKVEDVFNQHIVADVLWKYDANWSIYVTETYSLSAATVIIEASDDLSMGSDTMKITGSSSLDLKSAEVCMQGTQKMDIKTAQLKLPATR